VRPFGISTKVSFHSSVILSEASEGRTFPVAMDRAESKDLDGNFGAPGIKITLTAKARRRSGPWRWGFVRL
jgi:hypothetical protein